LPFDPPLAAYFGSSMLILSSEAKKSAKLERSAPDLNQKVMVTGIPYWGWL